MPDDSQPRNEVASGLVHDLNNLLTVVVGYSRLLLDKSAETTQNPQTHSYLRQIAAASERAAVITGHLLRIYRDQESSRQPGENEGNDSAR